MNLEAVEVLALLVGQASVDSGDCVAGGVWSDGTVVQFNHEGLDLLECFEDRVIVGRSLWACGQPDDEIKSMGDRLFWVSRGRVGCGVLFVRQLS